MGKWHVSVQGQRYGPYDDETLKQHICCGKVAPPAIVWTEGMADWKPIEQVRQFFPASGGHSSDMAFAYAAGLICSSPAKIWTILLYEDEAVFAVLGSYMEFTTRGGIIFFLTRAPIEIDKAFVENNDTVSEANVLGDHPHIITQSS